VRTLVHWSSRDVYAADRYTGWRRRGTRCRAVSPSGPEAPEPIELGAVIGVVCDGDHQRLIRAEPPAATCLTRQGAWLRHLWSEGL
jgi:hypothetical protein